MSDLVRQDPTDLTQTKQCLKMAKVLVVAVKTEEFNFVKNDGARSKPIGGPS